MPLYIITVLNFDNYFVQGLLLIDAAHTHTLKAFYALWHIILRFAGDAARRRVELFVFRDSACSISHTSIKQRHRDEGRERGESCTVATWLYSVSCFAVTGFLCSSKLTFVVE